MSSKTINPDIWNSKERRKMLFHEHVHRARRIWFGSVFLWTIAAIFCARLSGLREGAFGLFDFTGAVICGLTIGSTMSWFETRPMRPGFVNRFPWLDLGMRTVLYTVVVYLTLMIGRFVLFHNFPEEFREETWLLTVEILQDAPILRFIILMFFASFGVNFILHLRLMLGLRNMLSVFTGSYRLPVKEKRLFLFIDLMDSTAIAERIGPLEFTHFKHDFFCALSQPLASTKGTIVQYVGDEVMITWLTKDLSEKACPFIFIAQAKKRIQKEQDYYLQRYGSLPRFRSGIHAGEVVVAEVGDIRRDIVYSGDVVNSAARLLQSCRPEGVDLLISEDAAQVIHESCRHDLKLHGELKLRGRQGLMQVLTGIS